MLNYLKLNCLILSILIGLTCKLNYAHAAGGKGPEVKNRAIEIMNLIDVHDYEHLGGPEATNLVLSALLEVDDNSVNAKCLDVGSGSGGNTNYIKASGFGDIIGVDIDQQAIAKAKENYPNITFLQADALDLPDAFKQDSFGAIFLFNVASEVPDKAELLQKLRAVAMPGGYVVIMDYKKPFEITKESASDEPEEDKKNSKKEPVVNLAGNVIHPLAQQEIDLFTRAIGFKIIKRVDVTDDYINWFQKLLSAAKERPELLLAAEFAQEEIDLAISKYDMLHNLFTSNNLGAEIIIMQKR